MTTTILKTAVSDCGCSVDTYASGALVIPRRLNKCPLHAAAGEMRETLAECVRWMGNTAMWPSRHQAEALLTIENARALLAKVDKG